MVFVFSLNTLYNIYVYCTIPTKLHLERFFNLHSISEHILTEKLINYIDSSASNKIISVSRKNLTEVSVSYYHVN